MNDENFAQAAIDSLEPVEPSAHVRRLIAQIPLEHPRRASSRWFLGELWLPMFSLAAAAALGLYVGQSWVEVAPSQALGGQAAATQTVDPAPAAEDESLQEAALARSTGDSDLDTLLLLATAADFQPDDWDMSQDQDDEPLLGVY